MSSIIFCDGFDTYTTILDKWDIRNTGGSNGVPSIQPGVGRGGAGALSVIGASPAIAQTMNLSVGKNIGAHSTMYVGFAFYWVPGTQSDDFGVIQFNDGSTPQVTLNITNSGIMYFTRGGASVSGTIIGSMASVAFSANSFHYVEVEVVISSTVGVCQLKVDQASVLNLTGLNTQNSSNATFGTVTLGCIGGLANRASFSAFVDDVYFDTVGFNGDVRINGQLPTGNGTTQNFSPVVASWIAATVTKLQTTISDGTNLQRCTSVSGTGTTGGSAPSWNGTLGGTTVDNAGANQVVWTNIGSLSHYKLVNESDPDGDSSYVQSNTVNAIERFTFTAIVGANIATVVIWAFARKDDGGFRTIQGAAKSGSTLGTSGIDVSPGTNYSSLMLQFLNDPNTGAPWTLAAVNAAELGIEITN